MKNLPDLPESTDKDFWDGAEIHHERPREINVCETHTVRTFMEHTGFIDNRDGTVSCKFCPWGGTLSPNLRVLNGRLINLTMLAN